MSWNFTVLVLPFPSLSFLFVVHNDRYTLCDVTFGNDCVWLCQNTPSSSTCHPKLFVNFLQYQIYKCQVIEPEKVSNCPIYWN